MKPDIDKLKKALANYDEERYKLSRLIKDLEEVPKLKSLVGKYFKYSNSYNVNEHWWLFFHIKGYKNDSLIVNSFEQDSRSKIEFMFDKCDYGMHFLSSSYIEISKKEYERERKKILKKLLEKFKNK